MEGTDNEEEHEHDVFVAFEDFVLGESHFGLNLVPVERGESFDLEEHDRERYEGEDEEEEEDVVAVEEVVRHVG